MKIVPYRMRFTCDEKIAYQQDRATYCYGMPDRDEEEKSVSLVDKGTPNEHYRISTHDRGDDGSTSGRYYQIVFRVEDVQSPEELEQITLHLDTSLFRKQEITATNDLQRDEKDRSLWYQRTRYKKKDGRWILDPRTPVDSITTSGVFGVVVKRNGQILRDIHVPMVYVLPSTVTREDYIAMLNDLLRLHEELISKPTSQVGVDKVKSSNHNTLTEEEHAAERHKYETQLLNQLISAVKKVIRQSSEELSKRYTSTPFNKIKRFDTHVMQDYIRTGGHGKVRGIEYYENHDTYENRVIKYVLQELCRRSPRALDADRNMHEYSPAILWPEKHRKGGSDEEVKMTASIPSQYCNDSLKIEVDFGSIITRGVRPFQRENSYTFGLDIYCASKKSQVICIEKLANIYLTLQYNNSTSFYMGFYGSFSEKRTTCYIQQLLWIDGEWCADESADYSDEEYLEKLNSLFDQYGSILIKGEGIRKWEEDRTLQLRRAKLKDQQLEAERTFEKARRLLRNGWFKGISAIHELDEIYYTQRFACHSAYRVIYRLLTEAINVYPLLSVSFDTNRFGVYQTEQIYEYWVFYAILRQLRNMGFRLQTADNTSGKELIARMKDFVNTRTIKIPSITAIGGSAEHVRISLFHERKCGNYLPDYSICITQNDKNPNWYFLDAKYQPLDNTARNSRSCINMIYSVAIRKYIQGVSSDSDSSEKLTIKGSYIIAANIFDDKNERDLAINGRLYGGRVYIDSKDGQRKENSLLSPENQPKHRYGAIMLTPSYTSELKTLLQMIFEFHETNQRNDHELLNYCWSCGTYLLDHPGAREPIPMGNKQKYYVTCPICKAFRVDNFCGNEDCRSLIVKHTSGNYHQREKEIGAMNDWAYYCPHCGKGVHSAFDNFHP